MANHLSTLKHEEKITKSSFLLEKINLRDTDKFEFRMENLKEIKEKTI